MNPSLGIDIDGCIDECTSFFQILSKFWVGKVYIITYRRDRDKAVNDLQKFGIRYDELILVKSFDEKAEVIKRENISVYFDDQPEMLKNVSEHTSVMLVRNPGNFDFDDKLWMMSDKTGKLI